MRYFYQEVEKDPLHKTVWSFTKIDDTIYLDQMLVMDRQSSRHKFRADLRLSYSRLNSRDYGITKEPEVPFETRVDAVAFYRQQIQLKKWDKK